WGRAQKPQPLPFWAQPFLYSVQRSRRCKSEGGRRSRRGSQHRELVGDLELERAEGVDLGRPAARPPGGAVLARRDEHAAAQEDTLQVGRGDLVPEGRRVELAQLRD